eukprot:Colp12_sorted_trinity150504_noHs@7167
MLKQPGPWFHSAPTMLYFHGNAGNIGHRLQNACEFFHHLRLNVLLLEYSGYGKSEGSPCESVLNEDAEAGLKYLLNREEINKDRIIVFGRSLGGAVAINLASKHPRSIMCLMVENTFVDIAEMGQIFFPWTDKVPRFYYKNLFDNRLHIQKVSTPTLLLSGRVDELIPPKMMDELYSLCSARLKHIQYFADGMHNQTWLCSGYYSSIGSFLQQVEADLTLGGAKEETSSPRVPADAVGVPMIPLMPLQPQPLS